MEERCSLFHTANDPHWDLKDISDSDFSDWMISTLSADVTSIICFLSYQVSMMKILVFFSNYKEFKPATLTFDIMVLMILIEKNSE